MNKLFFASLVIFLTCLISSCTSEIDVGDVGIRIAPNAAQSCSDDVKPPLATSQPAPGSIKIAPPEQGIYPGLFDIGTTRQNYYQFGEQTGKLPVIVYSFHDFILEKEIYSTNPSVRTFTDPLEGEAATNPLDLATEISKYNSILALSWAIECCDFNSKKLWYNQEKPNNIVPRLLKGEFDQDIKLAAKQIKDFGLPIMLSIFAEFQPQAYFLFGKDGRTQITNTDDICSHYGDPKWPDGPERVRDTITHVIDIFRQEGVKNVTWFMYTSHRYMDPSFDDYSQWMHPKYFYPGDAYMDWVGQSAFFIDTTHRPNVNKDMSNIVSALKPGYDAWGEVTQRPMFLAEFGSPSDGKLSRAKLFREVLQNYLPSLPRVKAFTFANAVLFRDYFEQPLLGNFPDEVSTWKEVVTNNPYYRSLQPKQIIREPH